MEEKSNEQTKSRSSIYIFRLFYENDSSVQTGSGAHSAPYLMGTGLSFLGGVKLTIHLDLQPSLRMVELYLYSQIRLHDAVHRNSTSEQ
jgi:hypothetical protein